MRKLRKNIKLRVKKFDVYENGDYKFIWGIKSPDCLSSETANLYSMNDIDLVCNTKTKKYLLGVESIYKFDSHKDEAKYLLNLLNYFTEFMKKNNYNTKDPYYCFAWAPEISTEADSISELYTMFRIFVEGYNVVYGGEEDA